MSNLIHNEATKLRANFWNAMAVASFVTIGLIPAFTHHHSFLTTMVFIVAGMIVAVGTHLIGVWTLTNLKE